MSDRTKAPTLPYADLDILGGKETDYIAGEAVLAEMTYGWADEALCEQRLTDAASEALQSAASEHERHQLTELEAPGFHLKGVTVKFAYALRLAWTDLHGGGSNAEQGLRLLGMAMSDLTLIREAEARRRFQLERQKARAESAPASG